jgi:hypothetical protein
VLSQWASVRPISREPSMARRSVIWFFQKRQFLALTKGKEPSLQVQSAGAGAGHDDGGASGLMLRRG